MIKKTILLSTIMACGLYAEITIKDIDSKPSGRAKNFMIWQYLKQNVTPKEADYAYSLVEGDIAKIKRAYLKKSTNKAIQREIECRDERDLLSINEIDCFKLAMSPYKTLNLNPQTRVKLLDKLQSKEAKDLVKIQAEPYQESRYKLYNPNTILTMFVSTTTNHRRKNLNLKLSGEFINYMFSADTPNWKKFSLIKRVVNDDKLDNLQQSLLLLNGENVDSQSNFLLGLNQLRHSNKKGALKHFSLAYDKAGKQMDKDKNSFWMYQTTSDKKYLVDLSLSMKINMYTLYAKEKLNIKVDNYFSSVDVVDKKHKKNICDPFVWNEIIKEIKNTPKDGLLKLASKYNQKDMAAVQAFIIEKAYGFKVHGYIMPYDKYLDGLSNDDKALVYALMRQESNMVPSALSRSFALGLMQIMPFVTDDLSKRIKNPIVCYDDMFKPSYNIKYARKHLEWMKKSLYHPLFIAYAYNGGIGFFKKHLLAGTFSKGEYEPYLSMELMSNAESREYGKRVLANYVMYKKILGEDVSINYLLNKLTDPKSTDRFR